MAAIRLVKMSPPTLLVSVLAPKTATEEGLNSADRLFIFFGQQGSLSAMV